MAARPDPSKITIAAKRSRTGATSAAYRAGTIVTSRAVNRSKTSSKNAGRKSRQR